MNEYAHHLKKMPASSIGATTIKPEGGYDPIALITGQDGSRYEPRNEISGGVDEIRVEWCWFCHEEFSREIMVIRELDEVGRQWVCKSCEVANGCGGR